MTHFGAVILHDDGYGYGFGAENVLQTVGRGVARFFTNIAEDINAPKDRASWTRSTYERERRQLKRQLTRIGVRQEQRKAKIKTLELERKDLRSKAAAYKQRAKDAERELTAVKRQLTQAQRAATQAQRAQPSRRMPKRLSPEARRRMMEQRMRRPRRRPRRRPPREDFYEDEYETLDETPAAVDDPSQNFDAYFGEAPPNRAVLTEATIIETAPGTQAGVVSLGGGLFLVAEGVESVSGVPASRLSGAITRGAARALQAPADAVGDWRGNL